MNPESFPTDGFALVPGVLAAAQCAAIASHIQPDAASAGTRCLLPIHQDLSVPVASRVDEPGLRGWSDKEGALFVQAPAELLARLVAFSA